MVKLAETCIEALEEVIQSIGMFKSFPESISRSNSIQLLRKSRPAKSGYLVTVSKFSRERSVVKLAETCIEALEEVVQSIGILKSFPKFDQGYL